MPRSTKIVATLGPASSDPLVLERMLAAGVDVVRFNFSHGTAEDHLQRAQLVREASAKIGIDVAIMADLQGPKVRVGKFEGGRVTLKPGAPFVLDASDELGNSGRSGLDYKDLPKDVKAGDTLLLNDGLIVLDVERVTLDEIHTIVRIGGDHFILEHKTEGARRISQDEALDILKAEDDRGHIHTAWFKDAMGSRYYCMCNCCKCCCGTFQMYYKGAAPLHNLSSFMAYVAADACSGCGLCGEICPMEAVTITDGIAAVMENRCIGCGVCASRCPQGSIQMKKTGLRKVFVPPKRAQ